MQRKLSVDVIRPNADQPRKLFDRKSLDELADSIFENGLIQPITVRPLQTDDGPRFEITAGERRWRAHQILFERGHTKFGEVLCNVRLMDDLTRDIQAIIENMQRVDVTPLEESRAFQRMLDMGMSKEALAKRLGRQVWRIEERTRLLGLEPSLLHVYEKGQFPQDGASEIARITDHRNQMKVAKLIIGGQLKGYRAIRDAVDAIIEEKTQADIFGSSAPAVTDADVAVVNAMERRIAQMAAIAATGWKNGQCTVATKVSPDRARVMAEKLRAMQKALAIMERDLRSAAAQAEIVLAA